jgi:hypothetical protein
LSHLDIVEIAAVIVRTAQIETFMSILFGDSGESGGVQFGSILLADISILLADISILLADMIILLASSLLGDLVDAVT